MTVRWEASADLVVVGTGVAGLSSALEAVRFGLRTVVIAKGLADESNTRWAQGGLAVVLADGHADDDSLARHIDDTIVAGAGLCDAAAVTEILGDGLAGSAKQVRGRRGRAEGRYQGGNVFDRCSV